MPPKKKGGKKNDDWDEGLGESADPIAAATEAAKEEEAAKDGEEDNAGGGGLLAALKKNRGKKAKKGKVVEDFVDGEDPPGANGTNGVDGSADLASKAPVEATMDDEDAFDAPAKKGKGGKQQPKGKANEDDEDEDDDDDAAGGKVKTKKEKEKEKKEREKARKKEQVCLTSHSICQRRTTNTSNTGTEEEDGRSSAGAEEGSKEGRPRCFSFTCTRCGRSRDRRQEKEASSAPGCASEATRRTSQEAGTRSQGKGRQKAPRRRAAPA